jgi:exopolysaccharide biosynthesis polyprenyl glycosylphosphotransferase
VTSPGSPSRSPATEVSAGPPSAPVTAPHAPPPHAPPPHAPAGPGMRYGPSPRHRRSAPSSYARQPEAPEVRLQLQLMVLSDTVVVVGVLLAVFIVSNAGRMPEGLAEFLALRVTVRNLVLLALFAAAWPLLCRLTGLYHWQSIRRRRSESARVILTCGLVSALALLFPAVSITGAFRYSAVLFFWVGSSAAILILRSLMRTLVPMQEPNRVREALIVGTGPRAQRLERELRAAGHEAGYRVVGFVDSVDCRPAHSRQEAFLGSLDQVETILMHSALDEVLITLPIKSAYTEIQSVLESCERVGVPARFLADLFEPIRGRASRGGDHPLLVATPPAPEGWRLLSKRIIDLLGAGALLILCAPLLLVAAVAIKLTSRGPVMFSQERYGLNRRRFRMFKLRTMVADAEALQSTLEDQNEASGPVFKIREDPRVTPVGRLLRRTSVDELPQLFNVLRGEMSLVGPRPLPIRDVHRFTEAALMRRFSVRPGITCLWQIGGRSNLGFDDWIRLDLKYIDDWSLTLDVVILFRTIPAVVKGSGAS